MDGTFTVDGKTYTPETWRKEVERRWVRVVLIVVGILLLLGVGFSLIYPEDDESKEVELRRTTLVIRFQFSSAHHLPYHDGACGKLHGHTWRGEVLISAPVDETTGMSIDFSELKEIVDDTVPDHGNLNDSLPSPTCENVAALLVVSIQGALPKGLTVKEITLWESDRCGVRVTVPPRPDPVMVNR